MDNISLGRQGETMAASYLSAHGYTVLQRNYSCPMGELDIVARQGDVVAFVEVKTRRSLRYGTPAAAVNTLKQQKIIRTAYWYLRQQQIEETLCRFDVIEIYFSQEGKWTIQQFENAFEVHE